MGGEWGCGVGGGMPPRQLVIAVDYSFWNDEPVVLEALPTQVFK